MRSYRAFKTPEAQRELAVVMRMLVPVGWLGDSSSSYIDVQVDSTGLNTTPQQSLNIGLLVHESADVDFPIILDPQLHGSGH